MRFAAFSLAFAVSAIAFQTAGVAPSKPKREKPTPREKARELLDNAAGISASARPDVQASALLYIGEKPQPPAPPASASPTQPKCYIKFSHRRAIQAATTTRANPPTNP